MMMAIADLEKSVIVAVDREVVKTASGSNDYGTLLLEAAADALRSYQYYSEANAVAPSELAKAVADKIDEFLK
jgi:hypothetical protein